MVQICSMLCVQCKKKIQSVCVFQNVLLRCNTKKDVIVGVGIHNTGWRLERLTQESVKMQYNSDISNYWEGVLYVSVTLACKQVKGKPRSRSMHLAIFSHPALQPSAFLCFALLPRRQHWAPLQTACGSGQWKALALVGDEKSVGVSSSFFPGISISLATTDFRYSYNFNSYRSFSSMVLALTGIQ